MSAPATERLRRLIRRWRKKGRNARVRLLSARRPKTVVLVWGCHRSGTTMLLRLFRKSPWFAVFHEDNPHAMREQSRLRDDATLRRLIREADRSFLVFKPLNDAQYAPSQLDLHEPSRGVWIYRAYPDVVNSMIHRWHDAQKRIYLSIALRRAGDPEAELTADGHSAIYEENVSPLALAVIEQHVDASLTNEDAAALHWYLRNRLFFDLGLVEDPRVALVRYEDIVLDPDVHLRWVFEFVGSRYRPTWASSILRTSIGKRPPPALNPAIRALCEELLEQLDDEYERRSRAAVDLREALGA